MARDYLQIIKRIEGMYPKAKGTTTLVGIQQNQDEQLRLNLVGYFNDIFRELEEIQRWQRNFFVNQIVTTPGTSEYLLPGALISSAGVGDNLSFINRIYYRLSSGRIVDLELYDANEPRMMVGDGPNAVPGAPRWYSLQGTQILSNSNLQIQLYPTPDGSGPDSGNYTLQLEYYSQFQQIAESVVDTDGAGNANFHVAGSGTYLQALGIPVSATLTNQFVSIRTGGNPTGLGLTFARDDYIATWLGMTSSFSGVASVPFLSQTSLPIYYNTKNWLIDLAPAVLVAGVNRQVATYLKDATDYQMWENRYQALLEALVEYDSNMRHDIEVLGGALGGQVQRMLQDIDWPNIFDVRGNVL